MMNTLQNIKLPLIGITEQSNDIVSLLKSDDINTCINGMTALSYCFHLLEKRILKINHLIIDIAKQLIAYPDLDLSIDNNENKSLLKIALLNDMTDNLYEYLLIHGANPNIANSYGNGNCMTRLMRDGNFKKVNMLLRYGADPTYNCKDVRLDDTPICAALDLDNRYTLKLICKNTKIFYDIDYYIQNWDSMRLIIIYDSILEYGKIETLNYLGKKDTKIYTDFLVWITHIMNIRHSMTSGQLHDIFYYPIHNMIIDSSDMFIRVKKMILFKYNLECLIGMTIVHPKYIYYDIVIIFVFLLKYPSIVGLNSDTLKFILYNIFY